MEISIVFAIAIHFHVYRICWSYLFSKFVKVPGPHRGEIIRQIGHALREKKSQLGKLVSAQMHTLCFIQ